MALSTFNVSDVLLKLAEQEGIYLSVEGVDDVCYGCVISADKTFNGFLQQHALPYNWQILDGYPIRVVRRPINDSLTLDHTITQDDCIVSGGGAAVSVKRVDVSELPRELEIQYIDPDRQFATTTRSARHTGAPTTNPGTSIEIDFLISATQAREMAFDTLYRIWSQQLSLSFEHRDMTIEAGDTVHLTCDQGVYVALVQEATYTVGRTTQVLATVLLASSGVTLPPGEFDLWPGTSPDLSGATSPDWPESLSGRATFAGVGNMVADADILHNPVDIAGSAAFAGAGNLSVNATIGAAPQLLQGSAAFVGAGNLTVNATGPQIAFSQTLNQDSGDIAGYSFRNLCTLSFGGGFVRATFKSRSNVDWVISHASIGIRDTGYNTVSTPVELLFGGSSGVTVSAGQTARSDWVALATTQGQTAVVIADSTSGGISFFAPGSGTGGYYKAATASYADSAPSGSWTNTDATNGVSEVDVQ